MGGRHFNDEAAVLDALDRLHAGCPITLIIQGGAPGADRLARKWAMVRGVDIRTFSADWDKLGAAAGPVRNQKMLVEGRPDLVVAFPGGKGTADMVRRSERAGISAFRPLVPKDLLAATS